VLLGASSLQPPAELHVTAVCTDKIAWDKNLAPQCNLYLGADPDMTVAFKITRADSRHPDYPVDSMIYLAVSRYFFEANLGMQSPPVELTVGQTYNLYLKKGPDPNSPRWDCTLKAR
jgi:hypothetical protein